MVTAKNKQTLEALSEDFSERRALKVYLAFVSGRIKNKVGRLDSPIGRHPVQRHKMANLKEGGREALSFYKVLRFFPSAGVSLVAVKLITGRTHQARVHLQGIGHPIIGDEVYSRGPGDLYKRHPLLQDIVKRQMLHARSLSFIHSRLKGRCVFSPPWPEDFVNMLNIYCTWSGPLKQVKCLIVAIALFFFYFYDKNKILRYAKFSWTGKDTMIKSLTFLLLPFKKIKLLFFVALFFIFLPYLSGCVIPAKPLAKPFTIPIESRLVLQVPFFPDINGSCGPAALASMMNYSGRKTTAEQVMLNLSHSQGGKALGRDMVYWARKEGLKASFYNGSPDDMVEKIIINQPIIVRLDKTIDTLEAGSYAVVLGYNPEGVVINSCFLQQQIIPWSKFLASWYKSGYFTVLIEPM